MNIRKKYKFSILIIEDDYEDVFLIEDILNIPGYDFQITHFTHLLKVIESLSYENFDVALLDLNLPDSMGLETIKRLYEKNSTLPIIVLTGENENFLHLNPHNYGVRNYVEKGNFTSKQLLKIIQSAINDHNPE